MLRSVGASAVAFLTFFITPVSASADRPVDRREVVSAGWDLAEVTEQLAATADAEGQTELARAARALRQEAMDWYTAIRRIDAAPATLTADELPNAHEAMTQAFDDVAGRFDQLDDASAGLQTLWRMTQSRMHSVAHTMQLDDTPQ